MARIRSIKPEFFTDVRLGECSRDARLLFVGTWVFADDNGNLERSPKQLKAQVFPYDDSVDCEALLCELIAHECLVEYQVSGKKYLHVKNFSKHQKIDKKSKPRFPVYEGAASPQIPLGEEVASPRTGEEGKGEEGKGNGAEEQGRATRFKPGPMPEEWRRMCQKLRPDLDPDALYAGFTDYWVALPGRDGLKLDWTRTWANWCRNEKRGPKSTATTPPRSYGPSGRI